jgi:hypothetical protein
MTTATIFAGHPFFQFSEPAVWKMEWCNKWTVRWRDYYGIKQDADFDTESEARAFAKTVNQPPINVNDEDCDLDQMDAFWYELAAEQQK